jgi:hypothetical protein
LLHPEPEPPQPGAAEAVEEVAPGIPDNDEEPTAQQAAAAEIMGEEYEHGVDP